jgi:hypothetical protein
MYRATSSGLKQMLMGTSAYEAFVLECMTCMDGFLVLWETTDSKREPFTYSQVSLEDPDMSRFLCSSE